MKTVFKIVGSLIGGLALAGVVLYFMGSDKVDVSVSKVVKRPTNEVYNSVVNFKEWKEWSSWYAMDTKMKTTYEGVEGALDHKYCWESTNDEVGHGCQTIVETRKNEYLKMKLVFTKPFESEMYPEFKFEKVAEGTKVTWSVKNDLGVPDRIFDAIGDINGGIKQNFEKSLESLAKHVEGSF